MRRWPSIAFAMIAACANEQAELRDAAPAPAPPPRIQLSEEIDLQSVMDRSARAFYEIDGALVGGDLGYEARIDADGLTITAAHRPPGEPERISAPLELARTRLDGHGATRAPARRAADGSAEIDHGWAVERLASSGGAIEQSWTFTRDPGAPIVLRIGAPELALLRADQAGLHLAPAPGEIGLVYGPATWIDARGERTAIEARWIENTIVLEVPAQLVARSTWPAVLDPRIGPEIGPNTATYAPAPGDQVGADIALTGSTAVFVWRDARRSSGYDVYAARVNMSYTLLDQAGIVVDGTDAPANSVAVAFGGGVSLVVWSESARVLARRLDSAGALIDAAPVVVRESTSTIGSVDVAFDGTDFVVVYSEGPATDLDLKAARVSTAAVVRDPSGFVVAAGPGHQRSAQVAAISATVFAAWEDTRTDSGDVYVARIAGGAVLDPAGAPIDLSAGAQTAVSIAANSSTLLVGWRDAALMSLRVRPIDASAAPTGTARTVAGSGAQTLRVAGQGTTFVAAWDEPNTSGSRSIIALGLTPAGLSTGAMDEVRRSTVAMPLAVAGLLGSEYVFANMTRESSSGQSDLWSDHFRAAAPSWATMGNIVASAGSAMLDADLGVSGSDYLLAWSSIRTTFSGFDIFGTRMAADGTIIDTMPLLLGYLAGSDETVPAVAGDGSGGFLVTWQSSYVDLSGSFRREVQAVTLSGAGSKSLRIDVEDGAANPAAAGSPTNYVVAFEESSRIWLRRVSRSGMLIDTGSSARALSPTTGTHVRPSLAFDGSGYRAVWTQSTVNYLLGAQISTSGSVVPASATLVDESASIGPPAIALAPMPALIVWRSTSSPSSIRMLRADAAFAPIGSPVALAATSSSENGVAFASPDFIVAYDRPPAGVELQRVAPDGTARDPGGGAVVANASGGRVASTGDRRALLVYQRFDEGPTTNTVVARARLITLDAAGSDPNGTACTASWSCASGFCVDGFCCDASCGYGAADCQVCAASLGASANGTCTVRPAAIECRAPRGVCDLAEACDGASGACPADVLRAAGTLCGAPASDVCDADDTCDGTSVDCRMNLRRPAGTPCRAPNGPCDLEETCNGSSPSCPADGVRRSGEPCRAAAGDCDLTEVCDGTSRDCPADLVVREGTTCRGSVARCDLPERCDGVSAACPANAVVPAGMSCRAPLDYCDREEFCTGRSIDCPPDELLPEGATCRAPVGPCDVAELCDGLVRSCPEDRVVAAGVVCREAAGICDVAEACDGVAGTCTSDRMQRDGVSCDDGLYCNGESACESGACIAGAAPMCGAGTECVEVLQDCASPATADAGCSCRVSPRPMPLGIAAALLVLGALVRRRR